ncbi:hypothetical protein B0T49_21255 [Chromobacterium violaceum]|uniref:hypothetical protein n=1 Tax=Chromobacterium violaceum TaxID=536 RepID=UPI0009DAFEBF|nr:hypothetical protein [Chromobacterium violaceum]OQS45687.1 hypothetical protein B0T49_21255 [Chromobacterium violaceum]OQS47835.1 hypothetical protein B0T48_12185 [Chromobacterium violaceum]
MNDTSDNDASANDIEDALDRIKALEDLTAEQARQLHKFENMISLDQWCYEVLMSLPEQLRASLAQHAEVLSASLGFPVEQRHFIAALPEGLEAIASATLYYRDALYMAASALGLSW